MALLTRSLPLLGSEIEWHFQSRANCLSTVRALLLRPFNPICYSPTLEFSKNQSNLRSLRLRF